MAARPLICRDIFDFSSVMLNKIQRNLTGSKISMSSTNFVLFGPIKKMPPWPLVGWDIFDSSSVTAEQNSTKLDRKQNLNVLYQVRVIRRNLTGSKISTSSTKFVFIGPIGKTRWPPGLWLAETFSTSPLNGIQQNLIGNKICQRHLPSLCFSGWSEKHCTHVYVWPLGLLFMY